MSLLSLTNGAALGISPPAASVATGTDDLAGVINLTAGASGMATGTLCTFFFGTSYSDPNGRGNPVVVLGAGNAATAALGLYATVTSGNLVTIGCTTAPAASAVLAIQFQTIT